MIEKREREKERRNNGTIGNEGEQWITVSGMEWKRLSLVTRARFYREAGSCRKHNSIRLFVRVFACAEIIPMIRRKRIR